jgi:hypothetical protein
MSGGSTPGGRVHDPRATTLTEPPRRSSQTLSFERVIVPTQEPPPASTEPLQGQEPGAEAEPEVESGRYSFVDLSARRRPRG